MKVNNNLFLITTFFIVTLFILQHLKLHAGYTLPILTKTHITNPGILTLVIIGRDILILFLARIENTRLF